MRQREDRGDDKPEGVLRAPHLVEEEEKPHDQHDQLRDARCLWRLQPQHEHRQAAQQEEHQGHGVEDDRGAVAGIEAVPARHAGNHGVDGGPLPAAVRVEAVELAPRVRVVQVDRHVDCQPGHHRGGEHSAERRKLTLAQRHREVGTEQENWPQLKGRAEADEHACKPEAAVAGREHRSDGEEDGGDVPVGERVDDQQRGAGNQKGVPDAVARKLRHHADGDHPDDREQQRGDVEVPAGRREDVIH